MFSYKQEIGITFESKSQRTVLDQRKEEWLEELVVKKKKKKKPTTTITKKPTHMHKEHYRIMLFLPLDSQIEIFFLIYVQ